MADGITLEIEPVAVPSGCNVIVGGSHFIKTVQDVYEAVVESGTAVKFGVAFCEASGKRLVRSDGNDPALVSAAEKTAMQLGAGHSFVVYLKDGFPVNVLNRIKSVSEVTTIYAASANPLQVVVAESSQGRGILGVIDGSRPLGVETPADKVERVEFLRKIGYKR